MIELSDKFKSALGTSRTTTVYPVLRIYKGVRLDEENQDFEGQSDGVINLSIKSTTLKNFAGVYENYEPLLINTPSLTTTADLINNKFTTSNMSVDISNYEYAGKKFSDNVVDYLKSVCQVFFVCNGIDSLEDSLLMYTGTIRRFNQSAESTILNLEDYTQQVLSIKVPSTLIPENVAQYDEKDFGKPYPAVYGNLDATPLIYNKYDRLEVDKPTQKIYGTWNEGTNIEYQNDAVDNNAQHPLMLYEFLRKNSFLSVYDGGHLYIFQKGVAKWGSRKYDSGVVDYTNLEFYNFQNADTQVSAHFKIDPSAYVYSQYREFNGELEGTGSIGIPARVYRPIESVSFFAINQTNQLEIDNSDYNDQDDIEEDEFVYSHPYLSCNQFIGYQNNADIADNILEEMRSIPDQNTGFSYGVTSSYMQSFYEYDWNPDINPSPTMYWWRPTAINDNPQSEIQIWADKDVNWQNLNQSPEFNPQWIQNYNPNSGLHYKGVQKTNPSGAYARFKLSSGIGSYPCVTKVFYDVSTFKPHRGGDKSDEQNEMYSMAFWCEKELVERKQTGTDGFEQLANIGTGSAITYWNKNRGAIADIPPDDWQTPAEVPNSTHSGYVEAHIFDQDDNEHTDDGSRRRIDTKFKEQFKGYNNFPYLNILKNWNQTNSFDSVQWGMPINTKESSQGNNVTEQNRWCLANLKELYVIQDILVNELNTREFYGNVGGRIDDNGNQINRIDDISKDILSNEANFEQNIQNNETFASWKYDFVLNEQKELKEVFEGLYKSSIAIPSYDNFGQFKLIPIHQTLNNIEYQIIEAKDVYSYNFKLTKLDDVKNQVNVIYKKDYATGEFTQSTGYEIKDLATGNLYLTYDSLTQNIYPEDTYSNDELRYDIGYYGLTVGEAKLDVESEYIRDEQTARKLQQRLVSFYANQHLIIKCDLPLKYLNLESGDYIKFDSLLNDQKVFGYDYTQSSIKNGQFVYSQFFITKITKSIEKVSIEAVQVHRGEYGIPDDTIFNDDDDGFVNDTGGNDGNLNIDLGDPFDNPSYSDDTIDQDEPEIDSFNVSISENTILNNNPVYIYVNENLQTDWNYEIYIKKVSTPDGSGITYEDGTNIFTIPDGNYDEQNQPQINMNVEDLFYIQKNITDENDNFSGQLSLTKKYVIEPIGSEIEFEAKVFSNSVDVTSDDTAFITFKQIGEDFAQYNLGDINLDGIVNILDVVKLVQFVINNGSGTTAFTQQQIELADMNDDGTLSILDIVALLNLILG